MSNIKNNLMTKDDFTYGQLYQRLVDIAMETDDSDKAYATTTATASGDKGRAQTITSGTTPGTKECTWCAKHHPKTNNNGHSWNVCNKPKAFNEKRKKDREGKGKEEVARVNKESKGSETVGTHIAFSFSHPFTPGTAAKRSRLFVMCEQAHT